MNQSQARSVLDPSMEQRASRLDADQRLELERRRLWVRLSLLAVPVALIAGFGREAYGPSILSGACIFGSYALVSSLLNRRPAVVARFQIELRLLDVALLALCIYEIHVMMLGRAQITGELLFALYVQSVIAAASTDGWLGVAAIASASSIAIVADRLVLQANGYLSGADWGTTIVLPLVVADLTFMISASTVLYLMRVSGHAAARRERGLLHEITARNESLEKTMAELRAANDQLRRLDEMKSNFISTASHELRTPLTSIQSFSELLLDSDVTPETREEFTAIINSESERLSRLVNNLLDLSRVQAHAVPWQLREVDLAAELQRMAREVGVQAGKKGLAVIVDVEPRLPAVQTDVDGLRQVLLNLVHNALKFTDSGEIRLVASAYGDTVEIAVTDTGPGISPAEQAHVFDRFYQAGDHLTDKPAGTGLGLAISWEILQQLGGELALQSDLGRGSTFSFRLPVSTAASVPAPA